MRMDIGVNRVLINNSKILKLEAKAITIEDFTIIAQTVLTKVWVSRFNIQPAIIDAKEGKPPKFFGDPLDGFKDLESINCADELQAIGDRYYTPYTFPHYLRPQQP
jgi:hypothetical protein